MRLAIAGSFVFGLGLVVGLAGCSGGSGPSGLPGSSGSTEESGTKGGSSSSEGSGSSTGTSGSSSTPGSSGGTSADPPAPPSDDDPSTPPATGSSGPRPECIAFANHQCDCYGSHAAANCKTKLAEGCESGVQLCASQLTWYNCVTANTCGTNACTAPSGC